MSDAMRRLARTSLEKSRRALNDTTPPNDEAIHQARKGVKKVRAIVEAVDGGGRAVGRARKRLRRVNRILSPLRDADAVLSTLSELKRREPRLFTEHTFARLRHELTARKREAVAAVGHEGGWKQVDRDLRAVRASAKRWPIAHRGFKALEPSLRAAHRRARLAMARAERTQNAADFHEWRKRTKALWYELRLLEGAGGLISRHVAALHRAEAWLGDDHNVVVLCAELSRDRSVCAEPLDRERLAAAADRYQRELRHNAIASVRAIFGWKARPFARAIERAWKARRSRRRGARPHGKAA